MITEKDAKKVEDIINFIKKHEHVGETGVDWEKVEWQSLLQKLVNNLRIAHVSFRFCPTDKKHYYTECSECGWHGSSELLNGGGQIADTGDYCDSTCPVCDSTELDEKEIEGKT